MLKDEEMSKILNDYESHLLEDLEKHGPVQSHITKKSWMTLIMGRMIEYLAETVDEFKETVDILKTKNKKLEEENKRLKERLKKKR